GRGNITGHLSYADRGSLRRIDRPWAAVEVNDANIPFTTTSSRGGNFARSGGGSVFNLLAQGGVANSTTFSFTNTTGVQQAAFGDILSSFEHFIGANTRQNAALFFNYDLSDQIEFWARATITAIENTSNFSYATVAGTPAATFQVRRDSPFVTPELAIIFQGAYNRNYADTAAGTDMFKATVSRSLFELGPRTDVTDRVSSQFAMGLKGKLTDHLAWDFSIINGHSDEDVLRHNEGSPARLAQGLNVTSVGGVAACVDPSNGCVPINFFGPNSMSPQAVAWVEGAPLYFGRNRDQIVVSSNLFGDTERFFSFKGGPIKWSVGVEFRDEYGDMYWDPRILTGDYFGGTRRQDANAKFDLTELYTEVRAPILSDLPFIKHLEIEAAYRISDHSLAGNYDNSKIGFNWQIDDSFRIRGSQQTVFRAPNIGELWGVVGATVASTSLRASHYDPCTTTTDTAIRAICVATGAPAAPFTKNITVLNFPFGGDPTIKPEIGETYTLGFVATPTFIRGLSFGVDYWHIQLNDAIGGLSSDAMVRLCYDVSKDANSVYCQRIKRDATGNLTEISLVDINVSNFETAGYDFNATYNLRLPQSIHMGDRITFELKGGQMDTFIKQATPLEGKVNCVGKFAVPGSCSDSGVGSRPMPTIRGSLGIAWISKPLTLRATWRHFGDVIEGASPTGTYTTNLHKHIEAQNYLDLGATWRVNPHFRASFSVTNALDVEPPLIGNFAVDANTIPAVYDVIGRRYGLSLVYKF
ncbi:MAG: TonB-dependent receptor, partial [Hyphomonadaceae bacterium]